MPPERAWLATVAALLLSGCDEARSPGPAASVTMELPPPRPADARPGFSEALAEAAPVPPAAN